MGSLVFPYFFTRNTKEQYHVYAGGRDDFNIVSAFFVDFLLIILEEFWAFWRRIVAGDRGYRYNRRKGIGKRQKRVKGEEDGFDTE